MTEKEFRRLVTDLEIQSDERQKLNEYMDLVNNILTQAHFNHCQVIELKKAGSWAKGTMLNDTDEIDLMVVIKLSEAKPFVLENEAVLNAITNAFIYNLDTVQKLSDITRNQVRNCITVKMNNFKVNLYVRYEEGEYSLKNDELQIQFTEIANRDYTYFRNALKIIKYYKVSQNINISGYILEILLYYSLNGYFKDNRYEDYLSGFIKAIDDFLKGKKIEVSSDIYEKLNINPETKIKKNYMILDVANSNNNLTDNMSEVALGEYRKLKKVLSKLVDTKAVLTTSNAIVKLNINPTPIKDSDEYAWSYKIENSDFTSNGGSYQNKPEQLLTAMYKGLYKGLRAIVDNNLNRKNVEIICNKSNILKINENVSDENKSRIKNIEAYIDNNGIVIKFTSGN